MNEQDNITLIRNTYTAFGEGDVHTIMAGVDDNADWINHGPSSIPYAGARKGRDQILEFFQAIDNSTTGGKVTADNSIAQGDMVAATGHYSAVVRHTGLHIDSPVAHVFTIHDGKIVRWEGHSDTAHIAAAHGVAMSAAG